MQQLNTKERPLLIIGASARAAAESARRASFQPLAIDLFADLDLRTIALARVARPYPTSIPRVAQQMPSAPVIYTGALENHPGTVRRLAAHRMVLGNNAETLRRVRNPFQVARALAKFGVCAPKVARHAEGLPRDGSWLQKPRRGSAGSGVQPWFGFGAAGSVAPKVNRSVYFQERIEGIPCSAVFVAAGGRTVMIGVSRQLIGTAWTGAEGFRYAGSIGPIELDSAIEKQWRAIGSALAAEFALSGLFGVDAIVSDGKVAPVEVNPRYTASIEVLERSLGIQAISQHIAACRDGNLSEDLLASNHTSFCGKAIIYARSDVKVRRELIDYVLRANKTSDSPQFADIPEPESQCNAGRPVITVLANGSVTLAVEEQLRWRAKKKKKMLYKH